MKKHLLSTLGLMAVASTMFGHSKYAPDPFGPVVPKNPPPAPPDPDPELDKFMKTPDPWKPWEQLDFADPHCYRWRFDTRDWAFLRSEEPHKWRQLDGLRKVDKNPKTYVHTLDELLARLLTWYEESGGEGKWRHFSLKGVYQANPHDWFIKYINVYKVGENEYLVCNGKDFIFNKGDLAAPVDKEILHTH